MDLLTIYNLYKLLEVKQIGPSFFNRLVSPEAERTGQDVGVFLSRDFLHDRMSQSQLTDFEKHNSKLMDAIASLIQKNCNFIDIVSEKYPSNLVKTLKMSSPPILSCLGNIDLLKEIGVGFCGARRASDKGLSVTRDCALQFANNGVTVISGNASGVDVTAHLTALQNNGKTILVLPEGLSNFRVRSEYKDYWDWKKVLVVSEFSPIATWTASRAMNRNSTIVGLSTAMILIEAAEKGGSIDAGRKALKYKKKLYAPVYDDMPDFANGNELLLKEGAIPIWKNSQTGKANLNSMISDLLKARDQNLCETRSNRYQKNLF